MYQENEVVARQPASKTFSVYFQPGFLRSESHFSPGLAPIPPPIDSVECPALLLCINCWVIPSPGVIFRNPHNTARADILVQISLFTSPSRLHFLLRSSHISRSRSEYLSTFVNGLTFRITSPLYSSIFTPNGILIPFSSCKS